MGTRSFIAQRVGDEYVGVYCHWDGYLEHNGRILLEHYSDPEKLSELIRLGDISSLDESIGDKHDFNARCEGTTFYGRDRGEAREGILPKKRKDLSELMQYAADSGCEYFYLFDGEWKYAERGAQFFGGSDGAPFSDFLLLTAETVS